MPPVPARALALALSAAALAATAPAHAAAPAAGPVRPVQAAAPTPTSTPPASIAPAPLPDACSTTSDESPVRVEVTRLLPRAPSRVDEPFQVTGRLTNCGEEPLSGLQVRLAVGGQIASRSALRFAAEEPVVGRRRLPAQDAAQPDLAPGATTDFDVRVLVGDLALGGRNGVYPLAVQARARTGGAFGRGSVGLASTFVPWFPEGPVAPTRVAWVTPLVDEPHRGPGSVMVDDDLEALLEDDPDARGRLQRALLSARVGAQGACDEVARGPEGVPVPEAPLPDDPLPDDPVPCRGEAVPMTYALDPDLLFSVEAMTRPYTVRERGEPVTRQPSQNAEQWLVAVRAAATEGAVLALPYGDPDVVALSRTDSPVKDDVELLRRLGQAETRRLLGTETLESVAWPPPGPVASVVDPIAAGEDTALLLDETALEPGPALDRTPSARKTIPSTTGPVTALVADEALSALVEPDPTDADWQGARLAEQRWIAESAVIAAERPGESRTLVVAPRRRTDVVPAVLAAVIADTGRLPWLCPVPLADVAAGTEGCATLPDAQGPAEADDEAELRRRGADDPALEPEFVRELAEVRRASDQFTEQVLLAGSDDAKETKARLLRARGRAASTSWRDEPAEGRRLLALLQDDVRTLRSKITLVGAPVLLTGRSGTVRMVVQNGLDQPVNVGVDLDPTSEARLTSRDTELQVVPGNSTRQVSIEVDARTSGRFTVLANLVDASGQPFGDQVELQVRSTEYGRAALAVTGLGAAVLLVAVGVRIVRRALRRGPAAP